MNHPRPARILPPFQARGSTNCASTTMPRPTSPPSRTLLFIPADRYTPTGDGTIPTGEILPLKGTLLDFNQPTRIGDRIEQLKPTMAGYDHNYILAEDRGLKLAARLTEPKSGRVMEVRTTQPAIQLYTGNHFAHTAVCLETQHYPDAIHHPNFPSIVLRPGAPLHETTVFTFLAN